MWSFHYLWRYLNLYLSLKLFNFCCITTLITALLFSNCQGLSIILWYTSIGACLIQVIFSITSIDHPIASIFALASLSLYLVSSYVLIEYLVIELKGILLSQFVIQFSSMRLYHIASARWWAISDPIFLSPGDVVWEYLFPFEGRVLEADEPPGRRRMLLIVWTLPIHLTHQGVESICISALSL